MECIFNTRKLILCDDEIPLYQEILKGLEINTELTHKVVLLNDDKTTMSFVSIVFLFFHDINADEAQKRMMKIHENGIGELVVANKNLAEKIVLFVTNHAKHNNQPLQVQVHDI